MVAFRHLLGLEITPDMFKCRNCDNVYHVKHGVAALRRHFESRHEESLKGILLYYGLDKKHEMTEMTPEKQIKLEEPEEALNFRNFADQGPSIVENLSESALLNTPEKQQWTPSAKGRSIVWEHIQFVAESQRAACNYCQAEFQIKGGTSALLRHLKTNHPAAINFDPDNPPPVIRRRKRKTIEDYTIVTEDTKSYMDNLLETFMHEDMMPRIEQDASTSPQHQPDHEGQNRADSEIDEVIRNLRNETAQNGYPDEPDRNLRQLLGIVDNDASVALPGDSGEKGAEPRLDEEKQVSSSSGPSVPKQQKRKLDDVPPMMRPIEVVGGKFPNPILSTAIHRRPPPGPPIPAMAHGAPPPFPTTVPPHHLNPPPMMPGMSAKYNAQAVQLLDFEAKVLYNQSLHSTIAREDAMTTYYRMKSRKMELEIKKLERELGEEQEPEAEQEQEHEE